MSDKESLCLEGGQGILVSEGTIQTISQSQELLHEYGKEEDSNLRVYDCKGKAIIPGFVDCHTHLVWGGDRANEMQLRHSGLTYTDIAEKGGGIQKTVDFTRSMPSAILVQLAEKRIFRALNFGTTTIECKSGYGLSVDSELKLLKTVERPAIIKAIAEAREHGDLSENAEYHSAREKQSFIEGRIKDLESSLGMAEVIDPTTLSGSIKFGATILLLDEETEQEKTFQIVGSTEADIENGLLNIQSPLAKALIGKEVGDSIEVKTPGGTRNYEVLDIKYS